MKWHTNAYSLSFLLPHSFFGILIHFTHSCIHTFFFKYVGENVERNGNRKKEVNKKWIMRIYEREEDWWLVVNGGMGWMGVNVKGGGGVRRRVKRMNHIPSWVCESWRMWGGPPSQPPLPLLLLVQGPSFLYLSPILFSSANWTHEHTQQRSRDGGRSGKIKCRGNCQICRWTTKRQIWEWLRKQAQ